jgi:hypothetical protein
MYSLTLSPHFAAAVAIFFFSLPVSLTATRGGSFFSANGINSFP